MAKKSTKRNWILGIIAILILLSLAYFSRSPDEGIQVEQSTVKKRDIIETVQASGRIYPEKEVKISSDVSGAIFDLSVREGDSVNAGQFIAQIDPEVIESQVQRARASVNSALAQLAQNEAGAAQAEAQLEQARAQLNTQQVIHNRNLSLHEEEVISNQEKEQSQLNLDNAVANVKSAKAQLRSAEKAVEAARFNVQSARASLKELSTSLDRTTIYAPTEGIVSKLNVEEGERVVGTIQMTGTELMRIASFNTMEVRVEVSENDIIRLDEGNEVNIEVDAYISRVFKGHVTEIASSAADIGSAGAASGINTEQATNFIVKIRIDSSSYADLVGEGQQFPFRPGMNANVEIKTREVEDVVAAPIGAITTRDKEKEREGETKYNSTLQDDYMEVAFLIESDTVRQVQVVTGLQDAEWIEIKSGLSIGDKVASGPYSAVFQKLEKGDRVNVTEKESKDD
jgi:HlyD family secretion protein